MSEENYETTRKRRLAPHKFARKTGGVDRNTPHGAIEGKQPQNDVPVINRTAHGSVIFLQESALAAHQDILSDKIHAEKAINSARSQNIPNFKAVQVPQVKHDYEQIQRIKKVAHRKYEPKSKGESRYNLRRMKRDVRVPSNDGLRSGAAKQSPLELFTNPVLAPTIKNLTNETRILDLESDSRAVRLSPANTTHSATLLQGNKSTLHHHHLPGQFHIKGHNHAIKRAARKQASRVRQYAAIANFFGARTRLDQNQINFISDDEDTTNAQDSSTTSDAGSQSGPGFTVPGVLLACVSVIFIIIGIAFVYSRFRRSKPTPEQDQPDIEMKSTKEENDPYMEWLNMPEEPLPPPALGKQVKTVVRTVSRKMSLTPKPATDDFKPGVPPHLRYQLKEIYVY